MDGGNTQRLEVLGQSGAAAVVVAALYATGVVASLANFAVTKFSSYHVMALACLCALARLKTSSVSR